MTNLSILITCDNSSWRQFIANEFPGWTAVFGFSPIRQEQSFHIIMVIPPLLLSTEVRDWRAFHPQAMLVEFCPGSEEERLYAAGVDLCLPERAMAPECLPTALRCIHTVYQAMTKARDAVRIARIAEHFSAVLREVTLGVLSDEALSKVFGHVCQRLLAILELQNAWMGLTEPDGSVSVQAAAGNRSVWGVWQADIRWEGAPDSPVTEAIQKGEKVIAPGVRSKADVYAVFPLKANGQVLGVLCLCGPAGLMDARLIKSLDDFTAQVAAAMSFGLVRRQIGLFTTALEAAANAMIITDRAGRIWWANPAFSLLTGYSWFEVLGQTLQILKSGFQDRKFYDQLWNCILAGRVWKGELINKRKDGSFYAEEMTITPVRDEHGEISNFIVLKQDISERKRSEQLLHRYQLLSQYANDIIIFMRRDGRILEVNDAAVKTYGYTREQLLDLTIRDLAAPEDPDTLRWAGQEGILLETVHRRSDGSRFPVEASAIGSQIGGEWVVLAILRDITERKESETRLEQARAVVARTERLASLGTMAAGIAHEINQPLNSLKVTADGMLFWHKKGKPPEMDKVMENIRKISRQADRIDGIIKHMRLFVRSEDRTRLAACNLKSIVEDALGLVGNQIATHGIKVQTLLADVYVLGETARLEEVVINLLVNAMQALDQLEVKRDKEIICRSYTGELVCLEISDNGIGIDEEIKDRIFEPFFTTKPVGQGTGLGLSIVHSILSNYQAQIRVMANDTGGVTFRVEFPILDQGERGTV